jgi:lipopolysaccharide/colanic/teichoic acid biosynthesis glycosyltransferase
MRHHLALSVDIVWVALSAILAILIRDNFVPYEPHLRAVFAYAVIAAATCTLVFIITGLHKKLWQYTALPEVLQIMAAVTVALLLALFISFLLSRLEGVARSAPFIQWFLLIGAMLGTRVAVRIWHERSRRNQSPTSDASVQHVLIVGLSHLTELYLESIAEYAPKSFDIVGILSERDELRGRLLRFHKVLGTPEELTEVMARLDIHGVTLDRIVVMQPLAELSRRAGEALLAVERASDVKVDWVTELLGLSEERGSQSEQALESSGPHSRATQPVLAAPEEHLSLGKYGYVKRAFDILGAISLSLVLAPLIFVISLLIALDVGFPLVFWQKRPGRFGRPFKLFKFRTMRAAHDAQGNRLPDKERSSIIGQWLQRTRLDELPQLYNVLLGEMSFVGPRPLLPIDQPAERSARLSVRPGMTGFAQVRGSRTISPEDKNALDVSYIRNASLWLDIKILLQTPIVIVRGEQVDHHTLRVARAGLERLKTQNTANPDSRALKSKGAVGDRQVEAAHPVV